MRTRDRRSASPLPLGAWVRMLLGASSVLLAACEDQGNPGNDNLLTGGSLVLVIVVVLVIVFIVRRRK